MVEKKKKVKSKEKEGKQVQFAYHAPEATEVFLAGEFNGWDIQSVPLKKDKNGVWKASIKLPPGVYEYKLYADNAWVEELPGAEFTCNPFGTQNFIIRVT